MKYKYYLWWNPSVSPEPLEMGTVVERDDKYYLTAVKWRSTRNSSNWIISKVKGHELEIPKDYEWLRENNLRFYRSKKEMLVDLL